MTTLLPADKTDFDLETGCVVVGAGACGLVTALRLADAGIETLVLERDPHASGSTSLSSGFIPAGGTRQQRAQGISDSPAELSADILRKSANEADPHIVAAVCRSIVLALDWLQQDHGFEWTVLEEFLYPGHSACRMHSLADRSGAALQNHLLSACAASAVDIAGNARVDALVVDQHSAVPKICGVRLVRPDGEQETVKAASVMLACNGYGANQQLMQRFIPQMADACYHGHAANTGDAVIWGEQLGVPLEHMAAYQGHGSVAAGHNILITWALMMQGGIQVNQAGQRFTNEQQGYSEQAATVMAQTGGVVWNIYDQRLHELGMSFPDYRDACAAGAVICCEDAQTLARKTGLPSAPLNNTLKQIEQLAAQQRSDQYGRIFNNETALSAPWYTIKVAAAVFHTQGGLRIDTDARVIHSSGQAIDGLYAGGGAACGLSGSTAAGYLSGNGLLSAIALGLIAADTIIRSA